jgi:N4-gp56 family major capsid protein
MVAMTPPDNLVVQKWRKSVWRDYQRDNLFSEFMGNGNTAVIHRINELKDEGEEITIPLFMVPQAGGVTGDQTLVGNEHDLKHFGWKVRIDWWRDAVLLNKKQQRRSVVDQLEEVRPALTQIAANRLRDDIIRGFHNVGQGDLGTTPDVANVNGVYYPKATPTQRNNWHTANSDRVLYGSARSNYVAGDHAASLANVDATNDKFSAKTLKMLKRMAKKAQPHISPIQVEGGREYFGVFAGSNTFRDFAEDPAVVAANKDARARGVDSNPIFQDGDLILNGVWVREIPEMDDLATIAGAGAAGINVAPVWLVGRQAMGYAVGQLPKPTERKEDDYGFVIGRGIETLYGIGKTQFRNRELGETAPLKDWGVVTGFFASVDDA